MIKIPKNISDITASAGKSASSLWKKTKDSVTKAIDQDNDGALSLKDINSFAESIGNTAQKTIAAAKASAEAKSRENVLSQLNPFFREDLESAAFFMTKMIHVTEMDKKRAASPECQGSIGYSTEQDNMKVLSIFRDNIGIFGLSFYPNIDTGLYYVDPSNRTHYIAIDEYFGYLKSQRVSELQIIAQALGAKHFRITYKERVTGSNNNTINGGLKIGIGSGTISYNKSRKDESAVSIAAENFFPGHPPVEPKVNYLKNEPNIAALIKMRMDPTSPILHQKFTLELSHSSGIKQSDAAKIDTMINALKIGATPNFAAEAKKEANRLLEYEIDF